MTKLILERNPGATSLLDIACGTGEHLRHFADEFRHVEGIELSDAMIGVAAARMPDVLVHHADMRSFRLDRGFDAITCMFSAIGHMGTVDELHQALRCFADHLNPGGVIVIDPWWFPDTFLPGFVAADAVTDGGRKIARVSHSTREGDATRIEVHYLDAKPGQGIRHFSDVHRISLFSRREYERAFVAAGCHAVEYLPGSPAGRGLFVGVRP